MIDLASRESVVLHDPNVRPLFDVYVRPTVRDVVFFLVHGYWPKRKIAKPGIVSTMARKLDSDVEKMRWREAND